MNFPGQINSNLASAVSLDGEQFTFGAHSHSGGGHQGASGIVIPDKHLLFKGDYAREGNDLILSATDQKYVVHDYFKGEKRPALISEDGAMLAGHVVSSLTGYVQYAQAAPADAAQVIGHVMKLEGSASVIRNGVTVELNVGDAVQKGDVVQTGSDSSIAMTLIDGTAFGMQSNARMVLSEMVYDPNGSSNSSLMSLVQGTITFVAGQTAKNGNMRVETPVATMGIRGTAVAVKIYSDTGVVEAVLGAEPDGHVGGFAYYDNTTGELLGTVTQTGRLTVISPGGAGQSATATEQPLSAQAALSDKALFNNVFQLAFPGFNPDANPKSTDKPRTDSFTPPPTVVGKSGTDPDTGRTTITYTVQVTDPNTGKTSDIKIIFVNTPPQFSVTDATDVQATTALGPHSFKLGDHVTIKDPDFGAAPFFDVAIPYVTNSGSLIKETTTSPAPISYLVDPHNNIVSFDTVKGVVTYHPENFRFLGEGETAVYTFRFTSASGVGGSGSDTGIETLTLTVTGENDPPVFVLRNTPISFSENADVTNDLNHPHLYSAIKLDFTDEDFSDTANVFTVSKTVATQHAATHTTADLSKLPENATLLSYLTFVTTPDSNVGVTRVPLTDQGTVTAKFSAPDHVFDFLAAGEQVQIVYTITLDDGHTASTPTTETITFTITGTNDVPVLAADASGPNAITELATKTGDSTDLDKLSGKLSFTDVDLTDTHQASAALDFSSVTWTGAAIPQAMLTALGTAMTAAIATGVVNGTSNVTDPDSTNTGSGSLDWKFALPDNVFDFLAVDETLTATYNVKVTDSQGATSTRPVTITITGTNDAPVINTVAETDLNEQTDTSALTTTIPVTFTDVDLDNVGHTAAITNVVASGVTSGLALNTAALELLITPAAVVKASGSSSGSVNLGFSAASTAFDYLAVGEKLTLTYTVAINDHAGGVTPQTFVVVITGTNDAPTIGAATLTGAVTEDATAPAETGQEIASGTIAFGDVDLTDTHTVSAVFMGTDYTSKLGSLAAGKTSDTSGGTGGLITWTFTANDSATDQLAANQVVHETYTVTLNDGNGGVVTRDVVVTITGTNDAPVVTAALTASATEGDAVFTKDLLSGASDPDHGETASLTVAGITYAVGESAASSTAPAGVSLGLDGHTLTIDPTDPSFVPLALGETSTIVVSYNVTDVHGATVPQTETITITGTNDAPVISTDNLHLSGGGSPTTPVTVLGLSVSDPDNGDTFTMIAATDGSGSGTSASVTPASGDLTAINSALTTGVTYTPGSAPPGVDKVALTVTDHAGATDTVNFIFNQAGTEAVTLTGSNQKDMFFGTGQQDTFVFAPNSNQDTIIEFTSGTDKIDLHLLPAFDSAALTALLNNAGHPGGGDTLLHINGTVDTILVKVASLTASDFIIHA